MGRFPQGAKLPRVSRQRVASLRRAAAISEHRNLAICRMEVDRLECDVNFVMLQLNILNFGSQFIDQRCIILVTPGFPVAYSSLRTSALRFLELWQRSDYRIIRSGWSLT
jgi:hypothetical protein